MFTAVTSARDESTVGPEVLALGTQAGLRKGIGHLRGITVQGENRETGAGAGPLISVLSPLESLSFSHMQEPGVGL